MFKKILQFCFKILNIIFIWISFALIFIAIFKKEWFELFIEWMKVVVSELWYWNYLVVSLSSFIEVFPVLWVLLPGQNILLLVWWFFWESNYTNLAYIVLIATIWAILWNQVWYILWKYYWESFFEKYWIWFGIWKTEVKYLKSWIDKWWVWWITLGKFHPLTRSFLPFIAWSMGMKSKKFMIYNALWSFIRALSLVVVWVIFVKYYKLLLEYSWSISLIVLVLIWLYLYTFKKKEFTIYWQEKNKEMEEMSKK